MTELFIGVDVGLDGGIAMLFPGGKAVAARTPTLERKVGGKKRRTYDIGALMMSLRAPVHAYGTGQTIAVIEQVHSHPKQSVTSQFSLGYGRGVYEALFTALEIPFELVSPNLWKKEMVGVGQDKGASILKCHQLFPGVAIGRSHGMAEALLLAEWIRRRVNGGSDVRP